MLPIVALIWFHLEHLLCCIFFIINEVKLIFSFKSKDIYIYNDLHILLTHIKGKTDSVPRAIMNLEHLLSAVSVTLISSLNACYAHKRMGNIFVFVNSI